MDRCRHRLIASRRARMCKSPVVGFAVLVLVLGSPTKAAAAEVLPEDETVRCAEAVATMVTPTAGQIEAEHPPMEVLEECRGQESAEEPTEPSPITTSTTTAPVFAAPGPEPAVPEADPGPAAPESVAAPTPAVPEPADPPPTAPEPAAAPAPAEPTAPASGPVHPGPTEPQTGPSGLPSPVFPDAGQPVGPPASGIPAELLARSDAVERSGASTTKPLLDALAPLRAAGATLEEAAMSGFGRFPVFGEATYTHDWLFPRFGPGWRLHQGTDIFAPAGTPVGSPADGRVRLSNGGLGGIALYVTEADGTYYYLAHLAGVAEGLADGDSVTAGHVIGYNGSSGNALGTPPHVHFEVHPQGG